MQTDKRENKENLEDEPERCKDCSLEMTTKAVTPRRVEAKSLIGVHKMTSLLEICKIQLLKLKN